MKPQRVPLLPPPGLGGRRPVPRDLFPLPSFDATPPAAGGSSRSAAQARGRHRAITRTSNEIVFSLNELYGRGHQLDGCRPSHAQTSALRHVEQAAYRSMPRTSGVSSEAALREQLAAPVDSYEQAEPCTVMPYCYAEVSCPGSGGVMPLTSALPVCGSAASVRGFA